MGGPFYLFYFHVLERMRANFRYEQEIGFLLLPIDISSLNVIGAKPESLRRALKRPSNCPGTLEWK
ncbi:MAG: hypothetical protein A3C80_00120 [Candidatus Ryanbacteria bacterium RIFCSPHIGHO2_02_FULL_45_43]|uniref:Uncharacterized protein n=1 Tax=Candidatus Ryanbacteria bacterium RIFCSPHIGHO2_01_45_13 TaxID=1802112 RepID=A0A1G2G0B9_9BACT|nr:MAG: hypothetical protein A2718_01505 [Candidatus Ryanbacteria bacterium RIFCSPHIGHO2_01_FULL_44_130]OGZ43746.1 MAG: hypothetical protein A2W41_04620 [Candidatus Ryanbacteria bacterium RIFCSPHIGHO2_01_45_13]OGZ47689.1 MAG: hypothetical protein A3C80_00120 [Candidatus Ryanbacteria bacterium RIFCSPHIGHO2_02_FULL_45_43]OGZ49585.1 MAG: hypothetical protein A3E55_04120 [Candidatus Ryanbacteria bacterium RIFCSPHIGHO2_12_FULL_44_20]OGZ51267.1 MAG: hypothetical protein A3A17_04445 [Candidatus Ryanba